MHVGPSNVLLQERSEKLGGEKGKGEKGKGAKGGGGGGGGGRTEGGERGVYQWDGWGQSIGMGRSGAGLNEV